MLRIRSGERLVFIGDSITSCCRDTVEPPLGGGYVQFVDCLLAARYPQVPVEIVNRGVDGETIVDLEARWTRDVIDQRPDWLFLMVGTNDVLYRHVGPPERAVDDATWEATCRRLIVRTREALAPRIVLLDPPPLEEDLSAESHAIMRQLCGVARRVARELDLEHVPVFEKLYATVEQGPKRGWMIDVPHPNLRGQMVIALEVLRHLGW